MQRKNSLSISYLEDLIIIIVRWKSRNYLSVDRRGDLACDLPHKFSPFVISIQDEVLYANRSPPHVR